MAIRVGKGVYLPGEWEAGRVVTAGREGGWEEKKNKGRSAKIHQVFQQPLGIIFFFTKIITIIITNKEMFILTKYPSFSHFSPPPPLDPAWSSAVPPIGNSPQEEILKREYYSLGFTNSFADTLSCTEAQILDKIFIYEAPKVTVENWDQELKATSMFLSFNGLKMPFSYLLLLSGRADWSFSTLAIPTYYSCCALRGALWDV